MKEELLQYLWRHRYFPSKGLKTTDGDAVEVLDQGRLNPDAGPDFFNARIRVGDTLWAGNVEVHLRSSDWQKHGHQHDSAYRNVILHVVETCDRPIQIDNRDLPCMVLPIDAAIQMKYDSLLDSRDWLACRDDFQKVDSTLLRIWMHRLMIERLENKTESIIHELQLTSGNWNETFYRFIARNFGFRVNAVPFELLARSLPLAVLGHHSDNSFQIEALLFGQSGLLYSEPSEDDYFHALKREYEFLAVKYKLQPVAGHLWKFLRLRPVNFPTVRIAQFAALISQSHGLFSKIIEAPDFSELKKLFQVRTSEYWDTHFSFRSESVERLKNLGRDAFENLVVNSVVPFLFVYGEHANRQDLKDRSLEMLEQLHLEDNVKIRAWSEMGIDCRSAFESQALLELRNEYCEKKKCLNCQIGNKILINA
ncbi:MAG: DUF2851 family protein [Bacteroidota bacterium]|nr:DUF2851 family protein [Bacteroidota bacterium]MDP4204591.1 DUF2851 family protein [Bacteroidota bacterium]